MKNNGSLLVFLAILVQLVSIPLFYGILEFTASLFTGPSIGVQFFFLKLPVVNYMIIFSILIVTSIRETTQSELLTSVMHMVWILFIWSDTSHYFTNLPVEYIIYILCLVLTIPIRLIFQRRVQNFN